jgi:hypothetical protein
MVGGNLLHWEKFLSIIFHWKFLAAVFLSFVARYSFMLINNALLAIPNLAPNSTTITAFITFIGVIFTPHQFQVISEVIDGLEKKSPYGFVNQLLKVFAKIGVGVNDSCQLLLPRREIKSSAGDGSNPGSSGYLGNSKITHNLQLTTYDSNTNFV